MVHPYSIQKYDPSGTSFDYLDMLALFYRLSFFFTWKWSPSDSMFFLLVQWGVSPRTGGAPGVFFMFVRPRWGDFMFISYFIPFSGAREFRRYLRYAWSDPRSRFIQSSPQMSCTFLQVMTSVKSVMTERYSLFLFSATMRG